MRIPPGSTNSALWSNGKDAGFSIRRRGFNSLQGCQFGAVAKKRTRRPHKPFIEGANPSGVTNACEVLPEAHSVRTGGGSGRNRPQAPFHDVF